MHCTIRANQERFTETDSYDSNVKRQLTTYRVEPGYSWQLQDGVINVFPTNHGDPKFSAILVGITPIHYYQNNETENVPSPVPTVKIKDMKVRLVLNALLKNNHGEMWTAAM